MRMCVYYVHVYMLIYEKFCVITCVHVCTCLCFLAFVSLLMACIHLCAATLVCPFSLLFTLSTVIKPSPVVGHLPSQWLCCVHTEGNWSADEITHISHQFVEAPHCRPSPARDENLMHGQNAVCMSVCMCVCVAPWFSSYCLLGQQMIGSCYPLAFRNFGISLSVKG